MAKYAVLATLEWSQREEDGSLTTTRVEAGAVREDIPAESIDDLVASKAIEPYDRKEHAKDGWFKARYDAELDKATVKNGGIPRVELGPDDREIRTGDTGSAGEASS